MQWAELKAELLRLPVSELRLTQVKHAELGIAQLNRWATRMEIGSRTDKFCHHAPQSNP